MSIRTVNKTPQIALLQGWRYSGLALRDAGRRGDGVGTPYYWVGWYTEDPNPVENVFITGESWGSPTLYTMVAAIAANTRRDAWDYVVSLYPDADGRFMAFHRTFTPIDRFPGMQIIDIRKEAA